MKLPTNISNYNAFIADKRTKKLPPQDLEQLIEFELRNGARPYMLQRLISRATSAYRAQLRKKYLR